jgi:hypothetical protein
MRALGSPLDCSFELEDMIYEFKIRIVRTNQNYFGKPSAVSNDQTNAGNERPVNPPTLIAAQFIT